MRTRLGPAGYPRYGYARAHGYESGLLTLAGANPNLPAITLQHVGERWYDPGLGRFIQRDPIGLAGGLNVYLYCGANPLTGVDPEGLANRDWAVPWNYPPGYVPKRPTFAELFLDLTGGRGNAWIDKRENARYMFFAGGIVIGAGATVVCPPAAWCVTTFLGLNEFFDWVDFGPDGTPALQGFGVGTGLREGLKYGSKGLRRLLTPQPHRPRISVEPWWPAR